MYVSESHMSISQEIYWFSLFAVVVVYIYISDTNELAI